MFLPDPDILSVDLFVCLIIFRWEGGWVQEEEVGALRVSDNCQSSWKTKRRV